MHLTSTPEALPRACVRCPTSVRESLVDLDVQIDYFGAVFVCQECGTEIGRLLGMLTKDQHKGLEEKIMGLEEEKFELLKKLAGMEGIISGLDALGLKLIPERGDSVVLSPDAQGQGAESPESGDSESGTGEDVGDRARETPEPSDDEGVGIVRSDERSDANEFRLSV